MKTIQVLTACLLVGLAPLVAEDETVAPLPAAEPWVVVDLTNGQRIEGILREETAEQIVLTVERAGGTIVTTERITRTNIVAVTPLGESERLARAEQRALEQLRRYRLNPQTSYPASYYQQVIENVFRAFLERYPNSSHATEVAAALAQWQDELRRVQAGQVKYRGKWMSAAEAGALMEREQGAQLLTRARALATRGQYGQAIQLVELLPGAEARSFLAEVYPRWIAQLEQQTQRLESEIERVRQTLQTAEETKQRLQQSIQTQRQSLRTWDSGSPPPLTGPNAQEIAELNRANQTIRATSNQLAQLQARLATTQRELERARAGARVAGVALPKPGGALTPGKVVDEPRDDLASGRVTREMDYTHHDLLAQMAGFFRDYWFLTLLVVLGIVWLVSRRLSR
ncbi:MAG: hypothetical protein RMM51_02760 [Verrucomicrobiae bacterium]|nr:hypothetical protein [Verrucomicrobiae bacterium]